MTKKVIAILILIISFQASADDTNDKFYIGTNIGLTGFTWYANTNGTIFGGYRWDKISAEIGYTKISTENWDNHLRLKSNNIYFDVGYIYPLMDQLEVKGSLGLGIFHTKAYSNSNDHISNLFYKNGDSETAAGFRAGATLQYNFAKSWSADLSYNIQTNPNVFLGYFDTTTIGLKYYL